MFFEGARADRQAAELKPPCAAPGRHGARPPTKSPPAPHPAPTRPPPLGAAPGPPTKSPPEPAHQKPPCSASGTGRVSTILMAPLASGFERVEM